MNNNRSAEEVSSETLRKWMEEKRLFAVGFLRKGYQKHPAQSILQNTGAIYPVDELLKIGGFPKKCNGADGKTVLTEKSGRVRRAGMEAAWVLMEYYRRHREFLKKHPDTFFWAMISEEESDLPKWNITFPDDPERTQMVEKMINRQDLVGREWGKILLPDLSYEEIIEALNTHCYQG